MLLRSLVIYLIVNGLVLSGKAQAPQAIVGRVQDGATNKPVPFASVYINASTRGSTANANGDYELPGVPSGTVEIVASAVGYETARRLIRLGDVRNRRISFLLLPNTRALQTVTVIAKRPAAYNRLLKQFTRELLGDTPFTDKCLITNIQSVSVSQIDGHLAALATEPLVIENNALGYRLIYQLLHFDSYRRATFYGGNSRFEPMKPANTEQAERWERNRQRAYQGSGRHLLASLVAGTYEREGFLVFTANFNVPNDPAIPIAQFTNQPPTVFAHPDSLLSRADLPNERYFYSPKPLEVFYTRTRATTPYRDLPHAYSIIHTPKGRATIKTDGWVVYPNGMEIRGELSNDRLSTLLPADWQPVSEAGILAVAAPNRGLVLPPDSLLASLASDFTREQDNAAPTLFLHTDKGIYATGDRLWFSAYSGKKYSYNANNQKVIDEELPLHVELVAPDGRRVAHQWVRVSEGRGSGQFRLSDSLVTGTYQLRAYTEANRGALRPAFERSLRIVNGLQMGSGERIMGMTPVSAQVGVQFRPEGGRWLAGQPARVGVRAADQRGRGLAVLGQIRSAAGAEMARFTTDEAGLGSVVLMPLTDEPCVAQVRWATDSVRVTLPAADTTGLTLAADLVTDSTQLRVQIRSAAGADQLAYLLVQSRGLLVQQTRLQLQNGAATLPIAAAKLPVGVVQLLLFDGHGKRQATRLVYVPERLLPLLAEITPDKPTYAPRDLVTLSVRITDAYGDQLALTGSVVVTDSAQVLADSSAATIQDNLLIDSTLPGSSELVGPLLSRTDLAARRRLDGRLLVSDCQPADGSVSPERTAVAAAGIVLRGRVVDKKNRPLPAANLLLTFGGNAGNTFARTARTDQKGRFLVEKLTLTDTATVRIRPMDAAFKPIANARVLLDEPGAFFTTRDSVMATELTELKPIRLAMAQRQASDPGQYRNQDVRQLNTVTVRAKKTDDDRQARRVSLHADADVTVVFDENARSYDNAYEMLMQKVSGVSVRRRTLNDPNGEAGGYTVRVRGYASFNSSGNTPLYLIDGVNMPENNEGTGLFVLNPADITRIELLKNGGGAMYGARGGAGVIAFFTSTERSVLLTSVMPDDAGQAVYGYPTPRPVNRPDSATTGTDRRDVLLWKPIMATSLSGSSTLQFPLSDVARTIRVTVQGITTYGRPVYISRLINVR